MPNIVIASYHKLKDQDIEYKNIYPESFEDFNGADFFNEVFKENKDADLIGFMSRYDDFYRPNSLSSLVERVEAAIPMKAFYADIAMKTKFGTKAIYYPSFDYEYGAQAVINSPIFCYPSAKVQFSPDVKELHNYDLYSYVAIYHIMVHIPEILFEVTMPEESKDYYKDVEVINERSKKTRISR